MTSHEFAHQLLAGKDLPIVCPPTVTLTDMVDFNDDDKLVPVLLISAKV